MYSKKIVIPAEIRKIVREYSEWTADNARPGTSKKVNEWMTEADLTEKGKLGEIAGAMVVGDLTGLSWAVDMTLRKDGDGHRGDILLPYCSIGVKTRGMMLDPAYILAPKQGTRLLDDIGIVLLGHKDGFYTISGFVMEEDWDEKVTRFKVNVPEGKDPWRWGIEWQYLDRFEDLYEAIQIAESRGRERGQRQRLRSGRRYLYNGQMCDGMDNEV